MKKILIISHALELGGAERALLGLLEALDKTLYQVDLFLMRHSGELMNQIPQGIRLLPEVPEYTCLARPISFVLKEGHVLIAMGRVLGKTTAAAYMRLHRHQDSMVPLDYSHKFTKAFMPRINPEEEYDLAISFLTPHYFAAEKVKAKKRIAWIHTDYRKLQLDEKSELKMWSAFDHIAAVSDAVADGFSQVFPELAERVFTIENILSKEYILREAQQNVSPEMPDDGSIKLLSVGRFCTAKNFDSVPDICSRLVQKGADVKWYLIGFGGDEALIREKIEEAGMQDRVIILGKKENPYPYMAACDVYVQPSRYEGKCVAVREAQMLGKPVVITNYATSASQLEDGCDGIIVPMDNEGCAEGIAALINNRTLQEKLIENTKRSDYSNAREIEKLYRLIENED